MPKKVFELAKELDIGAIDLVEQLRAKGYTIRNHMQSLGDEEVERILGEFKKENKTPVSGKKTKKKSVSAKKVTKKKITKKKVLKKKEKLQVSGGEKLQKAPDALEEGKEHGPGVEEKPKTGLRVVRRPEEREGKGEETPSKDIPHPAPSPETTQASGESLDKKGKRKKLSGLASMMSGKKNLGRAETLAQQRSEIELKSYAAVSGTGRPTYTQIKRKRTYLGPTKDTLITEVKESKRVVKLHQGVRAVDLAKKLKVKFKDLADRCLDFNLLLEPDDYMGITMARTIGECYGHKVEDVAFDEKKVLEKRSPPEEASAEDLPSRPPVVAVMGHVDHGKTTLLDYIRSTKVAQGESGGITQHMGAYEVEIKGKSLTFLDTPGHAAFSSMRARGAKITDIVILVVAADDGVMPQTRESIEVCQRAETPIIVAINKMDKEGANGDRIKTALAEVGLSPEEWGGQTQCVSISALKGQGVDELLESVALLAEVMELKASRRGPAQGVVIESRLEQGRGPVATVLIEEGTLERGESIVVGESYGRARNLMGCLGDIREKVGPSVPVQILGLNLVPIPGDMLNAVKNEREAKKIVDNRIDGRKKLEAKGTLPALSLEDFFGANRDESEEKKTLRLIVRSDVRGSFEAIKGALEPLGTKSVQVELTGGGTGPISESDVQLAESAGAFIIGFNMRPVTSARRLAEERGIAVKTYSVIYELIGDIKLAIEGLLDPEFTEEYGGRAEVKETFVIPRVGTIAGCFVVDGKINLGHRVRLLRNGQIIHDGNISSLKRFKESVKEVKNNLECGIGLEQYNDIKVGDTFECYRIQERKPTYDEAVKEGISSGETVTSPPGA